MSDLPRKPTNPPLAESLPEDDPVTSPQMRRRPSSQSVPINSPAVDAGLRQANLLRVRGDNAGAEAELLRLLETEPAACAAYELLGDLQAQAGRSTEALASYRRAQSCGAGATVEGKVGRILAREAGLASESMNSGGLVRTGPVPIIASVLVPGLGLFIGGATRDGIITLVGSLLPLAIIYITPSTHQIIANATPAGMSTPPDSKAAMQFVGLGLVSIGFWVYSLVATARLVQSSRKEGQ